MTDKQTKPAPVKLDETQLDDAVGGIIAVAPATSVTGDGSVRIARVIAGDGSVKTLNF